MNAWRATPHHVPPAESGLVRTRWSLMKRRILHVVPGLERGGIETWLMHLLRHLDRRQYQMDFLVISNNPGSRAEEFRALGSRIIPCHTPWRFARDFAVALRRHGPYDIVHSHVHCLSGVVVGLAAWHGVPGRIVHSHNDQRAAEAGCSWRRRLYSQAMKHLIRRYATYRLAVSRPAAEDLFV